MTVYAIVSNLDGGYQYDRDTAKEANLKVGDRYTVSNISMGQSHTSIYLEGFDRVGFNSIYFNFEENGKPLNIYEDARFNPYI